MSLHSSVGHWAVQGWMVQIRTRPEFRFRSGTRSGGIWAGTGSGRFGRYQTGTAIFLCCIIGFMMSFLYHVPPPVPGWITCYPPVSRLYHVLPYSTQTASRALLQFPGCITCSPPVPKMYHAPPPLWHTLG